MRGFASFHPSPPAPLPAAGRGEIDVGAEKSDRAFWLVEETSCVPFSGPAMPNCGSRSPAPRNPARCSSPPARPPVNGNSNGRRSKSTETRHESICSPARKISDGRWDEIRLPADLIFLISGQAAMRKRRGRVSRGGPGGQNNARIPFNSHSVAVGAHRALSEALCAWLSPSESTRRLRPIPRFDERPKRPVSPRPASGRGAGGEGRPLSISRIRCRTCSTILARHELGSRSTS